MVTGRKTAAASTSEQRDGVEIFLCRATATLRGSFAALCLMLLALACIGPAAAAEVYVQQDATPLVSKPGIGGKVLTWVDSGFPLVVIGIEGEWLKVASPQLKLPPGEVWVPLARVGQSVPGQIDIAWRGTAPPSEFFASGFRLHAEGTPQARFRAHCLVVSGGNESSFIFADHVPADVNLDGDAVDCTISPLGDTGRVQVLLLGRDGAVVATTSPLRAHRSAHLRGGGSWGQVAGFGGVRQTPVVFRQPSGAIVPPLTNAVPALGNPVPAPGNPVPALGNPVPALGNPVPPFSRSPLPMQ